MYWHYPHYSGGLGGRPSSTVRMGDHKLIKFYENGHLELYNLAEDIGEQTDLIDKEPRTAKKLHALLKQWRQDVDARMPSPRPLGVKQGEGQRHGHDIVPRIQSRQITKPGQATSG
ncbi:MAG: hypothetical protein GY809_12365 [Planctomycetes bacterium]|nr:hypothetical protein [Planctomycetota bacterium]